MAIEIGMTKLPLSDRIEFFRTLSSWLTSGGGRMPVSEAIANTADAFSRDEYKSLAGRMNRITTEYESGQTTFYDAIKQANLGFTEQELAVVESAERSNQLRAAIPELVEALEMRQSSTRLLYRQMAMPVIGGFMLIVLSLGVAMFMLPMVLGPVLERQPDALEGFPAIVRGYWYFSVWMQDNWIIPIVLLMIPPAMFLLRNTQTVKPLVESVIWSIPPLKRIAVAYNGVLVVYLMPALVRSGMPLHDVLRAVARGLENQRISANFQIAANEHEAGMRVGDALVRVPLKGSFRSALEAGEKTGQIAERIEDLKMPYSTEYERIMRRAVGTLMVIVMAGLLPLFIMSMYTSLVAPIFALMEF